MDKKSIFQLTQYDVTQQIIETLANVYSRAVLFCIIDKAKDAQTIADDQKMSISTVYKILSQLEELTLIEVSKYEISDAGKKIKLGEPISIEVFFHSSFGCIADILRAIFQCANRFSHNCIN